MAQDPKQSNGDAAQQVIGEQGNSPNQESGKERAIKDDQAAEFLKAVKADGKDKAEILKQHPELKQLLELYTKFFGNGQDANGIVAMRLAESIREGDIVLAQPDRNGQIDASVAQKQEEAFMHVARHAMAQQAQAEQVQQMRPHQAEQPEPTGNQGAISNFPQPRPSEYLDKGILNRTAFLIAIEHPERRAEQMMQPENQDIRGAVGFYVAMEDSMRHEGGGISESEKQTLADLKGNLANMLVKNDREFMDKLNQAFDQKYQTMLAQQEPPSNPLEMK